MTQHQEKRLRDLINNHPDWSSWMKELKDTLLHTSDDFEMHIGTNWEKRQAAHLTATQHGWHSKHIMTPCARCNTCYYALEIRENDDAPCCPFHSGVCIRGCSVDGASDMWGDDVKGWGGVILFSKQRLPIGKKKRRRRNQWRRGLMDSDPSNSI